MCGHPIEDEHLTGVSGMVRGRVDGFGGIGGAGAVWEFCVVIQAGVGLPG